MLYENVSVGTVVHVDAPVRLTSSELMGRLQSTPERLGIRPELLQEVAGIRERRVWGRRTQVADAAALAGEKAFAASGVPRERVGLLVSTSVCGTTWSRPRPRWCTARWASRTPARTSISATRASPSSTGWTSRRT